MPKKSAIDELLTVMARLRSPKGCPWDREQDHRSLRWHAVEEVYELVRTPLRPEMTRRWRKSWAICCCR